MKALTVRQPWAWAIMHAGKDVENRTWRPPSGLLEERFVVHAAKTIDHGAPAFIDAVDPGRLTIAGAFLGTVLLDDAHLATSCGGLCSIWAGPPTTGKEWHWELADAEPWPEPVPGVGQLGLFDVPAGVLARG